MSEHSPEVKSSWESEPEKPESEKILAKPDVKFVTDRGVVLHLILRKILQPGVCDPEAPDVIRQLDAYLQEYPLPPDIVLGFWSIGEMVDEETFYWLALQAEAPGRRDYVLDQMRTYKSLAEPEQIQRQFNELFDRFQKSHPAIIDVLMPRFVLESEQRRETESASCRAQIAEIVDFFRPKQATSPVATINIAATGLKGFGGGGRLTMFGNEGLLLANGGDPDVISHEFLHALINPITEKITLTDEQEKQILALTTDHLKENYGLFADSILNETLINAYVDNFSTKIEPRERLFNKIAKLGEAGFNTLCRQGGDAGSLFKKLRIASYQELLDRREEVYELFYHDKLREKCIEFFEKYTAARQADHAVTFEDYFLQNFHMIV